MHRIVMPYQPALQDFKDALLEIFSYSSVIPHAQSNQIDKTLFHNSVDGEIAKGCHIEEISYGLYFMGF